ncbi:MAG: DUF423 domain-containing protein [Candidatus Izemoplasmataceae bacterium]
MGAKKLRSKLSVSTYKRPKIFIIITMIFINIIILLVAAFIALMIDDAFTSYLDALANGSVKWLLTPNAILEIDHAPTLFLAVVILLVGIVLFSGTIIALTTNAIRDYFSKKESSTGKIYLENHIIILNYNAKVPELIADLLYVESKKITLILLSNEPKYSVEKQVINAIKQKHPKEKLSKLNLLIKQGDPLLKQELLDISVHEASAILIMNKDHTKSDTEGLNESDLNVVKIVLGLGTLSLKNNPTIVAEVKHIHTKAKILTMAQVVKGLNSYTIIPICFDRRLGQIIAQTIIESKMEDIYLSLFSFEGSEVYFVEHETIDSYLNHYSHGIPLAFNHEGVFVLSKTNQTKTIKSIKEVGIKNLKIRSLKEQAEESIYIIGKNNKYDFIQESFDAYEALHKSRFESKYVESLDSLKTVIDDLNQTDKKATLLLLSNDATTQDLLDANVINTLIYIESHLKRKDIQVIVELLDPKNDYLIKDFSIKNTIISNKIISLLLSKLALFPETALFYEDLLTIAPSQSGKDDYAITVKNAALVINEAFPLTFNSMKEAIKSYYESTKKTMMLLGIFKEEVLTIFEGNLENSKPITIERNDDLILMKL